MAEGEVGPKLLVTPSLVAGGMSEVERRGGGGALATCSPCELIRAWSLLFRPRLRAYFSKTVEALLRGAVDSAQGHPEKTDALQ